MQSESLQEAGSKGTSECSTMEARPGGYSWGRSEVFITDRPQECASSICSSVFTNSASALLPLRAALRTPLARPMAWAFQTLRLHAACWTTKAAIDADARAELRRLQTQVSCLVETRDGALVAKKRAEAEGQLH